MIFLDRAYRYRLQFPKTLLKTTLVRSAVADLPNPYKRPKPVSDPLRAQ